MARIQAVVKGQANKGVEDMQTLRELRQESKKTVAEVAAVLGVAQRTISHYECGTRRIDLEYIIPLAKLYDVSAEEIIQAQIETAKSRLD